MAWFNKTLIYLALCSLRMCHQNRWQQAIDFVSKVKIVVHFAGADKSGMICSAFL
jgi:hypothetical protein